MGMGHGCAWSSGSCSGHLDSWGQMGVKRTWHPLSWIRGREGFFALDGGLGMPTLTAGWESGGYVKGRSESRGKLEDCGFKIIALPAGKK